MIRLVQRDDWTYDGVTLFADTNAAPNKLTVYVWDVQIHHDATSEMTMEYDRWMHVGVVYDHSKGKYYKTKLLESILIMV